MKKKILSHFFLLLMIRAHPLTECGDCGYFGGFCGAICDWILRVGTPSTGNWFYDEIIQRILDTLRKHGLEPTFEICCDLCCKYMTGTFGWIPDCRAANRALENCVNRNAEEGTILKCCPLFIAVYEHCGGSPPPPDCLIPTPTPTPTIIPTPTPTPTPIPTASPSPTPQPKGIP